MLLAQILTAHSMWMGFDNQVLYMAKSIRCGERASTYNRYDFLNNEADRWFQAFLVLHNMLTFEEKMEYRKMIKPWRY